MHACVRVCKRTYVRTCVLVCLCVRSAWSYSSSWLMTLMPFLWRISFSFSFCQLPSVHFDLNWRSFVDSILWNIWTTNFLMSACTLKSEHRDKKYVHMETRPFNNFLHFCNSRYWVQSLCVFSIYAETRSFKYLYHLWIGGGSWMVVFTHRYNFFFM